MQHLVVAVSVGMLSNPASPISSFRRKPESNARSAYKKLDPGFRRDDAG
jgi:hypothetical protein